MPATVVIAVTWSPKPPRICGGGAPSGASVCATPERAQKAPTS